MHKIFLFINKNQNYLIALIIFLHLFLLLLGGNKHYLWGDEAETALFAKNILTHGIPYGWDGTNIMGIYNGTVLNNKLINNTSPWLQYYLTALSFKLFGFSTFTARLPFILISVFSIFLLYKLTLLVSNNRKIAMLCILFYSLNIPNILFAYQTRYYALTSFFTILFCFYLIKLIQKHSIKNVLILAISGILFFHSNFLSFAAFFIASIVSIFIVLKPNFKQYITKFSLICLLIGVNILFWILLIHPNSNQGTMLNNLQIRNGIELSLRYFNDLNENGTLPIMLSLVFLWAYPLKIKSDIAKKILFIFSTIFLFIIFLSFLSPQIIELTPKSYLRYAINIFPLIAIIISVFIYEINKKNKFIGIVFFILISFTNIFSLKLPPNVWLFDYLNEMTNKKYVSSTEAVVNYLQNKVKPNDTIFVTPDYNVEPLQFYLQNEVKFVNRISPNNIRILNEKNLFLPDYIYNYKESPNWIVMFGKKGKQFNWRDPPKNVNLTKYKETKLSIYMYDHTRPEIFDHKFYPVTNYKENEAIFIYELIN